VSVVLRRREPGDLPVVVNSGRVTFELTGRQRRAWWPAVGAPVERGG
jgi:hypothetical protein